VAVVSVLDGAPLIERVPLMLVLLMSAVPVALPVMFTVALAVGSKGLATRGVLVTRLCAAEDATTMDGLCVDKTGTITMNQLVVTGVIPLTHATESDVLLAGALAFQEANQDPIDLAFLAAAKERRTFGDTPVTTPVLAVRRRRPTHGGRGRTQRGETAGDEGRRANRGTDLRGYSPRRSTPSKHK
jgi:H+-transporting ATPase